ncbi:hypothetical protein AJ80_01193 [Polytolypa hystricis UAMH7299]|uniref:Uncharacterized protein n=1 Tax=Polytolypa hystricis (strain UAMH7299) TaxID=1447883 RepID=A0A2B7YZX5_POLH7|nr:hypothetical protein AJ80_01193 [Polytolypa hystricis UAMH7299]
MATLTYQYLRFLFKIDFIIPDYSVEPERRKEDGDWKPPMTPRAITTVGTTNWRRWTPTGVSSVNSPGNSDFQVCSLFYNSETTQFLGVPFDCRKQGVQALVNSRGPRCGWRRITFDHLEPEGSGAALSVMAFDAEQHVLAATGSENWIPQLLPPSYNQNEFDYSTRLVTGLAGDLSLFIALAAFSRVAPTNGQMASAVLEVISWSFKPPHWIPHPFTDGKVHGHGVVVSIRLDPAYPQITASMLNDFQRGANGPILAP